MSAVIPDSVPVWAMGTKQALDGILSIFPDDSIISVENLDHSFNARQLPNH